MTDGVGSIGWMIGDLNWMLAKTETESLLILNTIYFETVENSIENRSP